MLHIVLCVPHNNPDWSLFWAELINLWFHIVVNTSVITKIQRKGIFSFYFILSSPELGLFWYSVKDK